MKFKKIQLKKTHSTNDFAIKNIKNNNIEPTVISSHTQFKGRGQYGKLWISLKGNLFMSIYFRVKKNLPLKKTTKINCLIVRKAINKIIKKKILIKPPNDLLIDKKKICGILQETLIHNNNKYLIVGIGVNIVKNPFIRNYLTGNLKEYTQKKAIKLKLYNLIIKGFEKKY